LLHGLGADSDVQGVLGDFPQYAKHVRGTPRKHVNVCAEKVNKHYSLFGVEGGAYPQRPALGGLRVEKDEFGLLRRLEAPGVALGVGDVQSEPVEVGN